MAKSFANCINTLVKSGEMSSTLADDLKARAEVYARGGYSAKDAHEMAITDALQEQQDDLRAVYAQIGMAPADDPLLVADTSAAAAPVATGDTSPVPVAETPESEQVSSGVADATTVSEEVPAQEAKTPEAPGRMNMRHTVKMADILTPAGAIKSDARNGNGRIWYHQGDPNAIQFAAKVTFGGKPAPARAIAEWESLKKAQELGYQLRNLKAGSLGTVWILHKDGKHVLTADGFEAITRPEFDRPVREVTGPGYDNMVSGQAQYATKLAEWFATLPESTLQSASALATKIGQTPIGEWASISRERNGELRFEFKTANGKRDLYHFGGETYADQVRMIVTLAGEAKNKGEREWFQVTAAASSKAAEANAADTPILDLLASYGFTKSAPAQTEAPSRYTPEDGDYSLDEHAKLIDKPMSGLESRSPLDNGISRASVKQAAEQLLQGLKNPPALEVVWRPSELPFKAPADAKGATQKGVLWIVAGSIRSAEDIREVIFHELTHFGLRGFFGRGLDDALAAIHEANPRIRMMAAEWKRNNPDWIAVLKSEYRLSDSDVHYISIDEAVAKLGQTGATLKGWRRFAAALQTLLRTIGLDRLANSLEAKTDAEALLLLKKAGLFTSKGVTAGTYAKEPAYPQLMVAWHGSPHDHDGFDSSKIGTGEGAQAYGWGHYFAGAREVAEWYRNKLAVDPRDAVNRVVAAIRTLNTQYGDATLDDVFYEMNRHPSLADFQNSSEVKRTIMEAVRGTLPDGTVSNDGLAAFRKLDRLLPPASKGKLYQVELAPAEDELLDWDKPLSEQSEKVKAAIQDVEKQRLIGIIEQRKQRREQRTEEGGDTTALDRQIEVLQEEIDAGTLDIGGDGNNYYKSLSQKLGGDREASKYLHSLGIRGIKYLDGSSRNRPLKDIKAEFLAELPEDADTDEVMELVGTGRFSPKNEALIKALADDDWLGFDYPAQAISAALGIELSNYDASPALLEAVSDAKAGGTYNYVIFDDADVKIVGKESRMSGSPVIAAELARYQAVVDKFTKRFKGASTLDIRLVSNRNEIPERYRPSPFAEGVFHSGIGTVWLVTDNLTPARANQVLLHEAIGHYGLASMMGQRFSGLLPSVKRVARAKATLVEDTLRPGDADYATWEAVKLRYPEASDVDVAQEVLARMAETDPEASFLAYARAVIRKWLREAARALGFDMDVSATELNDLVILASAHVRRGDNLADDVIEPEIAAASRSPEDLGRNIGAGVTAQTIADIPNPLIDRALAAAREAQNQSNAFDIEEEINSVRESGEVDFRKLRDNPEFFDTENEELTDAGYAEVDRLTEQQARDNLNLPSIDSIGDLDGAYHRAQADAMRVLLDGLGIEYEDNSSHNSQYLNVGRLKVRFADHGNTTRTVMHGADMLMNVSPNGATFTEALQAILDEGAPTPDSGELGSQALERSKMQERPAVRADESGSPEEPAQSGSGAGSKISVALESRAAQSALPLSGGQSAAQSAWDIDPDTRLTQLIYKLQDKHVDTKSVVKAIEEGTGSQVADSFDPYLGEELYHKRTATRVDTFVEQELKPLLNAMRLAGVGREEFEEYLHARHAKEANQLIRDRGGMNDGGSGMTDAEADAYFATLDKAKRAHYERLAKSVDAIIAGTRKMLVAYGLESQDTIDAWERMFGSYVPLNREDMETGTGIGQGFSVRGPAAKSRTGSSRAVADILANIAQQRDRAIIRGEKNRVATALYGLAYLNPHPGFWQAGVVPNKQVVVDGQIVTVPDHNYKNEPNVIVARIKDRKGQVHDRAIVFNRHNDRAMRLAGAMKNLDAPQMGELMNAAGKITRYLSAINTQYNPVFVFVNLVRDAQGAVFNLASTPLAGMQKEVAGHTVSALAGIYSDLRAHRNGQQPSSKWAMLYEEMQREGGTTGYRDMFGTASERSAEQIDKLIDPEWWAKTGWGKAVTVGGRLIAPETFLASKAAEWIFNPLSDANETAENAVRLAVYKTAIDHGMSKARAASLSKNITVNFNRKGQIGSQMNALYAFFNAAVQGTARLADTLRSPAGKQIIAGGILLGAAQALALAAAGFDDDDPPDFVRERNLIIPLGGKRFATLPMPLGLHILPNMGRIPMELMLRGFRKPGKAMTDFMSVFAEAFNPLGNAGLSIQTLTPSVIDPAIALLENKDWSGKPIARQGFDKNEPGYLRAKDTASPFGKFMAKAINTVTGGTPYTAGMYSPTPDQVDYLLGQATGGVGRETLKAFETVQSIRTGEDQPVHKVPLLGRFYGKAEGKSHESALFYENLDRIDRLDKELKGMRKDGLDTSEVLREHPETRLARMSNRVRLRISMLRRQKQKLVEAGDRQAVKVIEAQMTDVMRNFNASVGGATAEADTAH